VDVLTADDELADRIMAFMNRLFKMGDYPAKIEAVGSDLGGFEVETDMGSSFTFGIRGATRLEVARNYFDHAVQVHEHAYSWRATFSGWVKYKLGFGSWQTKEDRGRISDTLARLKVWGAENL
jgi:hypothetical protein